MIRAATTAVATDLLFRMKRSTRVPRSFGREELIFGKKAYPVMCFCDHCNNIILDSTPLDLRGDKETLLKAGADTLRLDFTVETYEETVKILKNTFV